MLCLREQGSADDAWQTVEYKIYCDAGGNIIIPISWMIQVRHRVEDSGAT